MEPEVPRVRDRFFFVHSRPACIDNFIQKLQISTQMFSPYTSNQNQIKFETLPITSFQCSPLIRSKTLWPLFSHTLTRFWTLVSLDFCFLFARKLCMTGSRINVDSFNSLPEFHPRGGDSRSSGPFLNCWGARCGLSLERHIVFVFGTIEYIGHDAP